MSKIHKSRFFLKNLINLFILNISYSKAIVYINQELSFLLKYKQEKKRRRRMTMNQEYHQTSSSDTDKPEELERIEKNKNNFLRKKYNLRSF